MGGMPLAIWRWNGAMPDVSSALLGGIQVFSVEPDIALYWRLRFSLRHTMEAASFMLRHSTIPSVGGGEGLPTTQSRYVTVRNRTLRVGARYPVCFFSSLPSPSCPRRRQEDQAELASY
jgi:hypothetical protein